MQFKRCCKCHQLLNIQMFNRNIASSDGLQSMCKVCKTKYQRQQRLKLNRELKINGCSICGYAKPLKALDFHHVEPRFKKFNLADNGLKGRTNEEIADEIAKCILLCKNCHCEVD